MILPYLLCTGRGVAIPATKGGLTNVTQYFGSGSRVMYRGVVSVVLLPVTGHSPECPIAARCLGKCGARWGPAGHGKPGGFFIRDGDEELLKILEFASNLLDIS